MPPKTSIRSARRTLALCSPMMQWSSVFGQEAAHGVRSGARKRRRARALLASSTSFAMAPSGRGVLVLRNLGSLSSWPARRFNWCSLSVFCSLSLACRAIHVSAI